MKRSNVFCLVMALGAFVLFCGIAFSQTKAGSDLTRILEIAIDTDDQGVINAIYSKAISGDPNAKEAMRTANPERFISLAKRGKYDIDTKALQFLKVMEGFGNKYALEAIKSINR